MFWFAKNDGGNPIPNPPRVKRGFGNAIDPGAT
jgi:hypothetical protein